MQLERLNYGSTPGDGTGDILYDIFEAIDGNFIALEDIPDTSNVGSIFIGTGVSDQKEALRYIAVTDLSCLDLLFMDEIVAGAAESGQYRYTVNIRNAPAVDSDSQSSTPWLTWTDLVAARKTGWERIVLTEDDGSGCFGILVINWSALTQTSYQNDGYAIGALCGISHLTNWMAGLDPEVTDIPLVTITEDATINGSSELYVVDGTENVLLTFEDIGFCRSKCTILNKMDGAYTCGVESSTNDTGDALSIEIPEGGTCVIYKNVDTWVPTQDFTVPTP